MNVKVTVDFTNGCCNVTGFHNGHKIVRRKYIRGKDWDGRFKVNYSKWIMQKRKYEAKKLANDFANDDTNFKVSEESFENLDYFVYKSIEDWDREAGNNYSNSISYLKALTQEFDPKLSKKECKKARAAALKDAGIDIGYNVGFFNTSKEYLTFIDKINGIKMALKQKRFTDANVIFNLFIKNKNYIDDMNLSEEDFANNSENKSYNDESNKNSLNMLKHKTIFSKLEKISKISEKKLKIKNKINQIYNSQKRHYSRKLRSINDSIKNFTPYKFKKFAIRGAATLLATGSLAFTASNIGKVNKSFEKNNNNKYETEYNADNIDLSQTENEIKLYAEKQSEIQTEHISEKQSESETERISERQSESETERISERQSESETERISEKQSESETERISERQSESETERISEKQSESETERISEKQSESETEHISEKQPESETERISEKQSKHDLKKESKKIIKQYKKKFTQSYMNAFVIGEKPAVGDMFDDQTFAPETDGTGFPGHFNEHPDYVLEHILVITDSKWPTIRTVGKSLPEVLAEYPDYIGYSLHFADKNGGLGFVTQSKLEGLIKDKVNKIIKNTTAKKSLSADDQDFDR